MFDEIMETEQEEETSIALFSAYNEALPQIEQLIVQKVLDINNDQSIDTRHMGIRFSDIVNESALDSRSVCVIGAGNLGNPIVRTLCNLGFKSVTVIDDDTVDIENISPQDHDLVELGEPKVKALERWALRHCGIRLNTIQTRVQDWTDLLEHGIRPDIVIVCVDNMELRNTLLAAIADLEEFHSLANNLDLYVDVRMSAGAWRAFILPVKGIEQYGSLEEFFYTAHKHMVFTDEEGLQEPCTARATNFTGYNAASYIGAFMAWYSKNTHMTKEQLESFIDMKCPVTQFKWDCSFDSMNWRTISKTPEQYEQQKNTMETMNELFKTQKSLRFLLTKLGALQSYKIVTKDTGEIMSEDLKSGSYLITSDFVIYEVCDVYRSTPETWQVDICHYPDFSSNNAYYKVIELNDRTVDNFIAAFHPVPQVGEITAVPAPEQEQEQAPEPLPVQGQEAPHHSLCSNSEYTSTYFYASDSSAATHDEEEEEEEEEEDDVETGVISESARTTYTIMVQGEERRIRLPHNGVPQTYIRVEGDLADYPVVSWVSSHAVVVESTTRREFINIPTHLIESVEVNIL